MDARPAAVLARVRPDGLYGCVQGLAGLLELDRLGLLVALQRTTGFAQELASAPLGRCAVRVCVSACDTRPTAAELQAGAMLEGARALGTVMADLPTPAGAGGRAYYVFIDVCPPQSPPPQAAAAAAADAADLLAAQCSALRLDVRPSQLASNLVAMEAAVGARSWHAGLQRHAPPWVTARIMAGLPTELTPPLPLSALDCAFGMVADAAGAAATPPGAAEAALMADVASSATGGVDVFERVSSLMSNSSMLTEREYNEALLPDLRAILGAEVSKAESDSSRHATVTDGSHFVVTAGGSRAMVLNLEVKMARQGGRPELQNIAYYIQHYFPRGSAPQGVPCELAEAVPLLPALLLDIHGGVALTVRGVVLAGFCVLSEVLGCASLVGRHGSPQHWALLRLLLGVRRGVRSLQERYRAALPSARLPSPLRGPAPTYDYASQLLPAQLVARSGAVLRLRAGAPLRAGCYVYEGEVELAASSWRACVVKLVPARYGEDAHAAAAAAGVAPALHAAVVLPGGWVLVVMERVAGVGWAPYDAGRPGQRAAVEAAVRGALHDAGFVHGDLRAANVLVRPRQTTQPSPPSGGASPPAVSPDVSWEVRLLDFDWAGAMGVARYPATRNPERLWASGSVAGGPILPSHDVEVLRGGM